MEIERLNLKNSTDKREVSEFLSKFDLKFEEDIELTLVIRDGDKIVATASKTKNIIKCFAVEPKMRGEGITNILVTNILNQSFQEGISHNFVYTKPDNVAIFEGVGFKLIVKTDKVALLEIGNKSIQKTIENLKNRLSWKEGTKNGIIIMNCNPFTLGHQYLIEVASKSVDNLLILVVEEDRSSFPFEDRIRLVREGVKQFKNVYVEPSTDYVISSATFPNYFLRDEDDSALEYMRLDITITAEYFCKMLGISIRFVGEEPICPLTNRYNETMKEILSKYGIILTVIARKRVEEMVISASKVRELIKKDDYITIKELVPETTYNYLISEKGKEVAERIKKSNSVH